VTSANGRIKVGEHHRASKGAWIAVLLIVAGFAIGAFALPLDSVVLWIVTGVLLVLGGIMALASRLMEQAY
jgi:fatty acid desaturase